MAVVAPALLAETAEDYKAQTERLQPFAERVHIDITDGEFAPHFTVSAAQLWWPENWQVDIHAMVARPSDHVQALIDLKPHMIIFHAEASEDLVPVLRLVKQAGIKAGVALLRSTVPETVRPAIEAADHVMIFSGNLGEYGGTANMMQLEKVRLVKMIRDDIEIGWDGGVRVDNVFSLVQGHVDILNAGGAIAKAQDPAEAYKALVGELTKHGVAS